MGESWLLLEEERLDVKTGETHLAQDERVVAFAQRVAAARAARHRGDWVLLATEDHNCFTRAAGASLASRAAGDALAAVPLPQI